MISAHNLIKYQSTKNLRFLYFFPISLLLLISIIHSPWIIYFLEVYYIPAIFFPSFIIPNTNIAITHVRYCMCSGIEIGGQLIIFDYQYFSPVSKLLTVAFLLRSSYSFPFSFICRSLSLASFVYCFVFLVLCCRDLISKLSFYNNSEEDWPVIEWGVLFYTYYIIK